MPAPLNAKPPIVAGSLNAGHWLVQTTLRIG
jgi:hypothetical protein